MFSGTDRQLPVKEPLVSGSVRDDALELPASGQWTVENARRIEEQIGRLGRDGGALHRVAIDVRAIDWSDAFGAWLLERLVRAWRAQGCTTEVHNLSDTYRELMEQVRHSNMAAWAVPQRDGALRATLERVSWVYGGINPDILLSRLKESSHLDTFGVGLLEAPFMALMIGVVACVEGYPVQGSAESLGFHTAASVVKSIFSCHCDRWPVRGVLRGGRNVADARSC